MSQEVIGGRKTEKQSPLRQNVLYSLVTLNSVRRQPLLFIITEA